MIRWIVRTALPPLLVFVVVVGLWEWAVAWRAAHSGGVYEMPLPRPSGIFAALRDDTGDLARATWTTAQGALIGFAASAVVGVIAAIGLASASWVRRAFYPYTVFFQTVPVIAIAPMLEIWAGPGLVAVSIVAFIVSVFPVISATLTGLLSTDPALVDLFQLYGAPRSARLLKLRLPWALPNLLTGLRVAAGLSVIGTVVAEFFVGTYGDDEGLGVRVVTDAKYAHVDGVFACVLLASLLGLALFGFVNLAGRLLLRRWHASERE